MERNNSEVFGNYENSETKKSIEELEYDLFLETLYRVHGYDFRQYSRTSLKRRLELILINRSLPHISSLIPLLIHNSDFRANIITELTINYSMLFRDTFLYKQLQEQVFPYLASYPRLSIWVAGCAEGEEAYSLAILLEEANLLDRTRIYATDISDKALSHARSGILRKGLDAKAAKRYHDSAGQGSLSDYFISAYGKQKFKQSLLSKIHFEKHNLVQQSGFISAELILCRNVFIYFNKDLQYKVIKTLLESLHTKGFFVTGPEEQFDYLTSEYDLKLLHQDARIYQKP